MQKLLLACLLGLAVLPSAAEARPRHWRPGVRVVAPHVRVYVGPWAFGYVPAPRAGWVWVAGHYTETGRWVPGYWRPAFTRAGWSWVPGYWVGDEYVDGYWREASRPGSVWVDGYYDDDGRWVAGYWAPANSADARRESQAPAGPPPEPPSDAPPEPPAVPEGGEGDVYHAYEE